MPSSKSFSGAVLVDSIQEFMDMMEAKYRRSFLALIESLTKSPELIALVQELNSGVNLEMSPSVYDAIENITLDTTTLRNLSRQAMSGGGRITAKSVGLEGRFDLTNPRAIQYARSASSGMVTGITKTIRQNLREIIGDAVDGSEGMAETVRRIKTEVGLTPKYSAAVRNYRKQLIANGRTAKDANKLAQKYAEKLLKQRAQTIARTEIAQATNFGQHEFWRQMRDTGSIPNDTMRVWITAKDEKTCAICGPMDGQTTTIDGSWMTGNGPLEEAHAHPNCRCSQGLVFTTKLKKIDPLGYEHWVISNGNSVVAKHYGGGHDQKTHGRRSGVGGLVDNSKVPKGEFKGSKRIKSSMRLCGEDGSYYDYIDWEDTSYHPVQQLLDMAAEHLPLEDGASISIDGIADEDIDIELLAESLDAFQVMGEFFPGIELGSISFENGMGNTGGSANALGDTIKINVKSVMKGSEGDSFISGYQLSSQIGWHVPSDISPTQKTVVHEFGHVVKYQIARKSPQSLVDIENAALKVIDPSWGVQVKTPEPSNNMMGSSGMMAAYGISTPFGGGNSPQTYLWDSRPQLRVPGVTAARGLTTRQRTVKQMVSEYAATNGHELWAEIFAEAYSNAPENLRPAAKAFYDKFESEWAKIVKAL